MEKTKGKSVNQKQGQKHEQKLKGASSDLDSSKHSQAKGAFSNRKK
jgi:hypothetical protein